MFSHSTLKRNSNLNTAMVFMMKCQIYVGDASLNAVLPQILIKGNVV
jgi:hypothetical protein